MPLPDYVALADQLGCDFVSVNFGRPANAPADFSGPTLWQSAALRRHLADAVSAHGLRIELVEGFAITPDTGIEHYEADLDAIAQLRARSICAVSMDKDMARTEAHFAGLADMAAKRGLLVTTEVGAGVLSNFEKARATWNAVAHPNFALLIDTMHFRRKRDRPRVPSRGSNRSHPAVRRADASADRKLHGRSPLRTARAGRRRPSIGAVSSACS
jgi:sugar phosphate isomerase/epimerase